MRPDYVTPEEFQAKKDAVNTVARPLAANDYHDHVEARRPREKVVQCRPEPLPLAPPILAARPYPVAALGPVLAGAARAISEKCQCPPAIAAESVLGAASLTAQRLADVGLPFGQTRPLSLFFVTVAGSSDRKTSADNEALIPVRTREKELRSEYEEKKNAHRAREEGEEAVPEPLKPICVHDAEGTRETPQAYAPNLFRPSAST